MIILVQCLLGLTETVTNAVITQHLKDFDTHQTALSQHTLPQSQESSFYSNLQFERNKKNPII